MFSTDIMTSHSSGGEGVHKSWLPLNYSRSKIYSQTEEKEELTQNYLFTIVYALTGYIKVMCMKYTGVIDGQPAVLRACGSSDYRVDGACNSHSRLQILGKTANNVEGCFCSTDKCNGAYSRQFTSISLFLCVMLVSLY